MTKPINEIFSGWPYLRKLAAHRRRIKREMAKLPPKIMPADTKREGINCDCRGLLPGKRPWLSLRIVNCANCGKTLLGESDEYLREATSATRPPTLGGRKGVAMICHKYLPPPIAGRVNDRPYCTKCKGV